MKEQFDTKHLSEGIELEAKLAGGRDGKGKLPEDVWETYSAFANTRGGVVLLGVKEHSDGRLEAVGIENVQKVIYELWRGLKNPKKVSVNLLNETHITKHDVADGRTVLAIEIPPADSSNKPVYLNGNPLHETYRREHDADFRCSKEEVQRMLEA